MKTQQPGAGRHQATVTRTELQGGGAAYTITISAESEAIVETACAIEEMTAAAWVASAVNIRLVCLAQALVQMAETSENETIN